MLLLLLLLLLVLELPFRRVDLEEREAECENFLSGRRRGMTMKNEGCGALSRIIGDTA